mgnify:CR=1 FL=1
MLYIQNIFASYSRLNLSFHQPIWSGYNMANNKFLLSRIDQLPPLPHCALCHEKKWLNFLQNYRVSKQVRYVNFRTLKSLSKTCLDTPYKSFYGNFVHKLTQIILWLMNKSIQQISRSVEFSIKYAYLAKLQPWWVKWGEQSREKWQWNKPLFLNFGCLWQDIKRW